MDKKKGMKEVKVEKKEMPKGMKPMKGKKC